MPTDAEMFAHLHRDGLSNSNWNARRSTNTLKAICRFRAWLYATRGISQDTRRGYRQAERRQARSRNNVPQWPGGARAG